jgi:hypothetical protein
MVTMRGIIGVSQRSENEGWGEANRTEAHGGVSVSEDVQHVQAHVVVPGHMHVVHAIQCMYACRTQRAKPQ